MRDDFQPGAGNPRDHFAPVLFYGVEAIMFSRDDQGRHGDSGNHRRDVFKDRGGGPRQFRFWSSAQTILNDLFDRLWIESARAEKCNGLKYGFARVVGVNLLLPCFLRQMRWCGRGWREEDQASESIGISRCQELSHFAAHGMANQNILGQLEMLDERLGLVRQSMDGVAIFGCPDSPQPRMS